MSDLVNGEPEGEAVQGEDGEEQEATLVKKHMKLESELGEEEETAKKENVDDKTEDQVPDITLEDPMTTSMDGIEEISATEGEAAKENGEAQEGEGGAEGAVQPEEEEAAGDKAAEDETTEKDAAEIPVNVYEEGGEGEKAAEAGEEPAPAGEEVVEEEKVEEKPEEEETTPAAAAEEEAAAVEEQQQQPEAAEQPEMVEVPVEAEPEAEQKAEEPPPPPKEEEQFELKAPPAPRKPRKTYKPDWMAEPEPKVEKTEAEEEKPAEQEEAPAEAPAEPEPAAADEVSIEVEKFGEEEAEKPAEESAPVEQGAPEEAEAAPKSGGAETVTPKSPRGRAFDFEKKAPAGKKTTFEDEVLSVKSSRSGRSGPRSPRSPRTPKTPTKAEEEVKPAAEEAAEVPPPEKTETEEEEEEKMRQRQTSYEERQREREEEEARWKRMTSWDRGEDGTIKEEEPKAPAVEAVEEEEVPKEAAEEAEAKPEEQEEAVPAEEEGVEKVEAEGGDEAMKVIEVEPEEAAAPAEEQEEEQKSAAEEQPVEGSPPPPPPRPERSPSPVQRREPAARDYLPYDQDLPKETVPSRLPAGESFSSWAPVERESYKPISPWVDRTSKYRNEYTVGEPPVAPSAYTAFFDDLVSTGPFASSLYSTSRLLERSRSRTRERRQALRSQSQARNYFRFASQHPPPLRSRDFSTPPSSMVSRAPTEASSFVSFMDYAGAKQYEMARSQSLQRTPLYQSNLALSRSISRGGIDYYLGSGRISRVDSYVDSLHNRYEWNLPSNYELYRASNRGQVSFAPLTNYQTYVDSLQRSLSRERYERDRLRNKYTTVSYQLEQALKQMDLLRSQNYSALRSGSAPRTSVYAHFYPYY